MTNTTNTGTTREKVGLLAGAGRFPFAFAEAANRQGKRVHCIGVAGMASDDLANVCSGYEPVSLMRIGKAIRQFKRAGVKRVVMAGKIDKTVIFKKFRWLRNIPDLRMILMTWRYYREQRTTTDDSLMLAVIREFARDDIQFESALEYCPELLVKHGFLTRRKPSSMQWRDINFGWKMAKELGRLDIGQTIVVNDTAVIAVEALEGTDAAILRAGQLCSRGGFTVVKVAKPKQDMRFDVPTVGVKTLQSMHEAGGRVLAVESGMTILLEEDEVISLADKLGIAIVSLKAEELELRLVS